MPVSVGFQVFRPASWFVMADTDAARNPARFIPANVSGHWETHQQSKDKQLI
jgi:hypothetical protein